MASERKCKRTPFFWPPQGWKPNVGMVMQSPGDALTIQCWQRWWLRRGWLVLVNGEPVAWANGRDATSWALRDMLAWLGTQGHLGVAATQARELAQQME